jgi:hypothetical protein
LFLKGGVEMIMFRQLSFSKSIKSDNITQESQRHFLDRLGKKMGFQNIEDWYKITQKDLKEKGGSTLLMLYGGSPSKLVQSIYPKHEWMPWRFETVAKGTWNKLEPLQRIKMINWLEKELRIESPEDWYRGCKLMRRYL